MDLVMIANAWDAALDNPTSKHQIALELVRQGHRVLWVEGAGMRRPSLGSGADRGRIVRKLRKAFGGARATTVPGVARTGLWVVSPLLIPLPAFAAIRALNGFLFRVAARGWARWLGFRDPVLINYVPVLSGAMRGWPRGSGGSVRCVYHCVDRWDEFAMYDRDMMRRMDARCHAAADLVITSSHDLYERSRTLATRVILVNHGVDHAHFASALSSSVCPADLPAGPLIGFFGLLSEWVDQDLLLALARALPQANLVLIGKADVDVTVLDRAPNVHRLGPRPFAQLPAYVGQFTVGLIPFKVSTLTRAVNPIKLREMLAAGCPVVSTALPEVDAYARCDLGAGGQSGVRVAATPAAFVEDVMTFVAHPLDRKARARLSTGMLTETWTHKTHEILDAIIGDE